eukprot:1297498-Pyramimonas_sp.AAC.1
MSHPAYRGGEFRYPVEPSVNLPPAMQEADLGDSYFEREPRRGKQPHALHAGKENRHSFSNQSSESGSQDTLPP